MQAFNPFDSRLKSDPYALFKQYREHDPVQLGVSSTPGYADTWYIFGFEEARQLLRCQLEEPKMRVNDGVGTIDARSQIWQHLSGWPLFQDPPLHTARRMVLANHFKEPMLSLLNADTERFAEALLVRAQKSDLDELDVQTEFSFPLAIHSICQVIGIEAPDTTWFKDITFRLSNVLDLGYVGDSYETGLDALNALIALVKDKLAWKKNHLGNDLLSKLIQPDEHGNQLEETTIVELITQMLFAGQETLGDAIGNGVKALSEHPDQLRLLRSKPELGVNGVSEMLRYDTSVIFNGARTLLSETKIGNHLIGAGQNTIVVLASCNHDERRFQQAAQFDITRDLGASELTFGHGLHYCLGAQYARQVMQIAIRILVKHLDFEWELVGKPTMRDNTILRGPRSLKLKVKK